MARFPKKESDIRALAQNVITGLTENAAIFTAPPITPAALQAVLDSYITLCDEAVAARGAAEQATATKDAGLDELIDGVKTILHYAEDKVANDDAKLTLLGWGSKADGQAMLPPGQPRALEAPRQGEGWIFLDWKEPAEGGPVASYRIERRERPAGPWTMVGMEYVTEITLNNQERNKDWEYRVFATNKAGEGPASNTIAAVV